MVIKNFLFHRVSPEDDPLWPPMKPELFTKIIRHLTLRYDVVPLEAYLESPKLFPAKKTKATVLFDDGYKDNIEYAAPLLKMFNCPASFYIVTDCIDRNIPTWTFILDHILSMTQKKELSLEDKYVPLQLRSVPLQAKGSGNGELKEIKPWLKTLSNKNRLAILQTIQEQCNDVAIPRDKMMSWNDVKSLHADGFIIGSHSHTHPLLASLQNEDEITAELSISAERIRSELGISPRTISYPIGSFDRRVIDAARKTGYSFGLAVKQRFFNTVSDDRMEIPRVELYQESWWKTGMRLSGVYSSVKSWKGRN